VIETPADPVERALLSQAATCAEYGSPFYGALLTLAAADYRAGGPTRTFLEADPYRTTFSRVGIRLMGALQYRAMDGSSPGLAAHFPSTGGDGDAAAAWREARALLATDGGRLAELYERTPQTNEVARAMPLFAGLQAIVAATSLPVVLLDVGTSAGLNLRLDRFRYVGDGWSSVDPASALVLRNATHLDVEPRIVERAGCDLHPLDVRVERDRRELRCFVWPDQRERFERLDAAIAIARDVPAELEEADFLEWIPRRAVPKDGVVTVIMHSVVTEHLPPAVIERMRRTIEDACSAATRTAPMAWLRLEPDEAPRYGTRVTLWPWGSHFSIARSDGHAQSIEWTAE
jgi:hypothetical protein